MSQQHSPDNPADGPAIVAWGHESRTRLGRLSRRLTGVGRDPRVVTVTAGLGAVAIAGSLLAEWAVATLPGASPDGRGPLHVPQTVNDVGAFGTAYLVGVLALTGCVALVLFGGPAIRRNLRVGGLTLAAGLLVMLGGLTSALGQIMNRYFFSGGETLVVQYGRGLILAFVGVATLAAALLLAARLEPARLAPTAIDDGGHQGEEALDWPWRRPGAAQSRELAEGPADLTVTPVQPFAGPEAESPVDGAQPPERGGRRLQVMRSDIDASPPAGPGRLTSRD